MVEFRCSSPAGAVVAAAVIGCAASADPVAGAGGSSPATGGTSGSGAANTGIGGSAATPGAGTGGTGLGAGGTAGFGTGGTAGVATGGTAGVATGGTAGAPTGGAAGAGSGGTATGGTGGVACTAPIVQTCSGMAAPADGVVIDFATYTPASGAWGVSATGDLTGGTSVYGTASTRTVEAGALRVQASLEPMGHTGLVFWFGPCVNASAFGGVSFALGGNLGGTALVLQVQTHLDYPAEPDNAKGACIFTSCDRKWTDCRGPTTTISALPAGASSLPWSSFGAGLPVATVTPEGLVGLQYQFECHSDTACALDVTIGSISFLPL